MITFETLHKVVDGYFYNTFDELWYRFNHKDLSLHMEGSNGRILFNYTFDLREWSEYFAEGNEYHQLENIKGQYVTAERKMHLEKRKEKAA